MWLAAYYLEQLDLAHSRCGLTELVKIRRALGRDLRLAPVLLAKVSSIFIQRLENGSLGRLSGSRDRAVGTASGRKLSRATRVRCVQRKARVHAEAAGGGCGVPAADRRWHRRDVERQLAYFQPCFLNALCAIYCDLSAH